MRAGAACAALLAAGIAAAGACSGDPDRPDPVPATPDEHDAEARRLYPDLAELYAGDQGIYRGCAPNGGVCHNSRQFPNMDSLGSIVDNIGRDCNAERERPEGMDDLCERPGDRLLVAGAPVEIAWVVPAGANGEEEPVRRWTVRLREPAPPGPVEPEELAILRGDLPLYEIGYDGVSVALDPSDASGATLTLDLPPAPETPPPPPDDEEEDDPEPGAYLAGLLAAAGVPGDPTSIQLGDPNRNGVFGAELGGKIIAPGDPARSYLLHRLTDPVAGPLMPRANCCHWSLAAVRAYWCWVDGLAADGSGALDPIDYEGCGPGPAALLIYPQPGPACESSGLCPVEAVP